MFWRQSVGPGVGLIATAIFGPIGSVHDGSAAAIIQKFRCKRLLGGGRLTARSKHLNITYRVGGVGGENAELDAVITWDNLDLTATRLV